ncbi:MAG TPA: EamA family transporter [Candidatus Limnocylindrales bacterium]|nr:EamA family transporter [Candidatus Limnocylindrales bacterium]
MPTDLAVAVFGLSAALSWGTADFAGGLASRRMSSLAVVLSSQVLGVAVAAFAAIARAEPVPALADVLWGFAAGAGGGVALVAFYRALAIGRVSTVAPIAGVLAAAVPIVAASIEEGLPTARQAAGIALALVAVVLVSVASEEDRLPAGESARRTSIALATIAGLGFGLFYVLIARVSDALVFWPLVASRAASITSVGVIALLVGTSFAGGRAVLPLILVAGTLDVGGNAGFLLGAQAGRLDIASILASLYPIVTVALAILVLRERVGPRHAIGMAAAGAAIVLIAGASG